MLERGEAVPLAFDELESVVSVVAVVAEVMPGCGGVDRWWCGVTAPLDVDRAESHMLRASAVRLIEVEVACPSERPSFERIWSVYVTGYE